MTGIGFRQDLEIGSSKTRCRSDVYVGIIWFRLWLLPTFTDEWKVLFNLKNRGTDPEII
jgi:hypothetical protein